MAVLRLQSKPVPALSSMATFDALQQAMRDANEHDPGSERFIYFGHGPNASEIEQAVITKLEPALEPHLKKGGLNSLKPVEFSQLVRRALASYSSSSTSLNQLLHALRRDQT